MQPPASLCVCVSPLSAFECLSHSYETWYVYKGQLSPSHLRALEIPPISLVYICISPFGAGQRTGKHVPAATNTCNSSRIVGRMIFCTVLALSKESLWVCMCIPLLLPD
jgi:hypothetical protein